MTATVQPLARLLARHTREGELYEKLEDDRVRCVACGHRCLIPPGREGICQVRFNEDGVLQVPFGYVAGLHVDPIEKKPFFHVLPGAKALSFGMLGCDFHCAFCQNWITSQTLRDPEAWRRRRRSRRGDRAPPRRGRGPHRHLHLQRAAHHERVGGGGLPPREGRGLLCAYVSNGNATPEVLDYLRPSCRSTRWT